MSTFTYNLKAFYAKRKTLESQFSCLILEYLDHDGVLGILYVYFCFYQKILNVIYIFFFLNGAFVFLEFIMSNN